MTWFDSVYDLSVDQLVFPSLTLGTIAIIIFFVGWFRNQLDIKENGKWDNYFDGFIATLIWVGGAALANIIWDAMSSSSSQICSLIVFTIIAISPFLISAAGMALANYFAEEKTFQNTSKPFSFAFPLIGSIATHLLVGLYITLRPSGTPLGRDTYFVIGYVFTFLVFALIDKIYNRKNVLGTVFMHGENSRLTGTIVRIGSKYVTIKNQKAKFILPAEKVEKIELYEKR